MKKGLTLVFFVLLVVPVCYSQNYTWMRGSYLSGVITGTYGTQNISAPGNDPGCRHGAATWVDLSGNLWMMGGEGYSSVNSFSWLNDLWKYDVSTNQWTWIRGSNAANAVGIYGTMGAASPINEPGAREFPVTWTDASGNFWLFGGDGFASNSTFGRLADLWKYDPLSNQWTWMKGFNTIDQNGIYGTLGLSSAANLPGARYGAATWMDSSGKLWLFGGRGFPASGSDGFLNDLWNYNPSTNQWTWVKGSNLIAQTGNYGTLNTTSAGSFPGGREFPGFWISNSGDLYMLGGRGFSSVGPGAGYLGDFWKYNPASNNWTWIHGPNITNQAGVYGTAGISAASNLPGGRMGPASWKDGSGNLWLFGGLGYSQSTIGYLNDLFKYDVTTNEWSHMKGSVMPDQFGSYGSQGFASTSNNPGGRYYNTWWKDHQGDFWLFGGLGFDSLNNSILNMNDLWRYRPPCNPDSITATPVGNLCSGTALTFTAYNQFPSNVKWYTTPNSTVTIGSGSIHTTPPLIAVSSASIYTYYAEANSCTTTPRASVTITVNPLPNISVSGDTSICLGKSTTLTASGASSYTWISGQNNSSIVVSPTLSTNYIVLASGPTGCQNSISVPLTVLELPQIAINASHTLLCIGDSTILNVGGALSYTWSNGQQTSSISVKPNSSAVYSVSATGSNNCIADQSIKITVNNCSGINESPTGRNVLIIYPNPNRGVFTVSSNPIEVKGKLKIYNAAGGLMYESKLETGKTLVNCGLPAGLYFYQIESEFSYKSGKIILE
jgi:N-acetylneuraminic acid mutarotase